MTCPHSKQAEKSVYSKPAKVKSSSQDIDEEKEYEDGLIRSTGKQAPAEWNSKLRNWPQGGVHTKQREDRSFQAA